MNINRLFSDKEYQKKLVAPKTEVITPKTEEMIQ